MNKFYVILLNVLILFCIVGCSDSNTNSERSRVSDENSSLENKIETIYEDDENINLFANKYNEENAPKITSEMLSVYHHHGSDHKDQVKVVIDGFELTITGGIITDKVSVYIENKDNNDNNIKKLIIKIVKVFNSAVKDEDIIKNIDSQDVGSNIDVFDDIEYWTNKSVDGSRIEYIKITGKIK